MELTEEESKPALLTVVSAGMGWNWYFRILRDGKIPIDFEKLGIPIR